MLHCTTTAVPSRSISVTTKQQVSWRVLVSKRRGAVLRASRDFGRCGVAASWNCDKDTGEDLARPHRSRHGNPGSANSRYRSCDEADRQRPHGRGHHLTTTNAQGKRQVVSTHDPAVEGGSGKQSSHGGGTHAKHHPLGKDRCDHWKAAKSNAPRRRELASAPEAAAELNRTTTSS